MDKEEFIEVVKNMRKMIESGEQPKCTCSKVNCEWYGKCYECVLVHRFNKDHVPECMKPILKDKIRELAKVAELEVSPKESMITAEYWDYVNKVCPKKKT